MNKKFFFLLSFLLLVNTNVGFSQCYGNNCIDAPAQTTPVPGCCTATTTGMTTSYGGTISGCANFAGGQDVWLTFMAPSNGYLSIDFTAITIAGTVNMIVFDSWSNADNCATLNAGGVVAACESFNAATPPNPLNLNYVQAGERYFILVSTPPGSTPGSFQICLSIVIPTGGMDCPQATALCTKDPISLNAISTGGGAISGDNTIEDLSADGPGPDEGLTGSCFGNGPGDGGGEVNSQWYTFTCGLSGTLQMALNPLNTVINCGGMTLTSDDYDFMLLDITKTGTPYYTCNIQHDPGADSATIVKCNWAGGSSNLNGLTGFGVGTAYTSVFGYTSMQVGGCAATDDFWNAGVPGAWTNTDANIVIGRTYALMISNYTGASTSGFALNWGGTGLFGVQTPAFTNPVISGSPGCTVTSTITAPLNAGALVWSYKYLINWGDGTTQYASSTNITHNYTASGTYLITMLVTDPVGCQNFYSYSIVIDCPLPVELGNFTGMHNEQDKLNRLDWVTYSEVNNDHFVVESSPDASNWKVVGSLAGAGNSSMHQYYHLNDYNYYDVTYYRLKQIDYDGNSKIYGPISVKTSGGVSNNGVLLNASIYPNPTDGNITIQVPQDIPSYVVLYDLNGRQVFNQTLQGSLVYQLSLETVEKGLYIVSITSAAGSYMSKVIVK